MRSVIETPTAFWLGGGTMSLSYWMYMGVNVRQTEIHTAEPLVPELSAFEVKMAIEKLKNEVLIKSQQNWLKHGVEQLTLYIHKFLNSIRNNEELSEDWKESIIVPTARRDDKTDCCNYRGLSLLSTTCRMLSNILLSLLTPYAEEIIVDYQGGFQRHTQVNYWPYILHVSNTWEKMGIQWSSASAIYRLQESLWFREKWGLVIFSLSLVSLANW